MNDHSNIEQTVVNEQELQGLVLTSRETQCTAHALQGKNILQISEALAISPKSVFYYLNSVQMKINKISRQALRNLNSICK